MSRLPTCPPGTCDLIGKRVRLPWGPVGYIFGCTRCQYATATVDRHG